MASLYPSVRYDSVYDINLADLKKRGIRGIVSDLDNTLVPWHSEDIPSELVRWLERVKTEGFKFCLVSNAGGRRAERTARALGVPVVAPALKPRRKAFESGVAVLGLAAGQVAMLGDQLFMDVWGARRAGLYTILVKPVSRREFIGTRLIRPLERLILLRFERRNADNSLSSEA